MTRTNPGSATCKAYPLNQGIKRGSEDARRVRDVWKPAFSKSPDELELELLSFILSSFCNCFQTFREEVNRSVYSLLKGLGDKGEHRPLLPPLLPRVSREQPRPDCGLAATWSCRLWQWHSTPGAAGKIPDASGAPRRGQRQDGG